MTFHSFLRHITDFDQFISRLSKFGNSKFDDYDWKEMKLSLRNKICIIEVYSLKYYFESHLKYK